MIQTFYNARTGAVAHNQAMEVVSNNIANINTVGYKQDQPTFSDTLYNNLRNPEYTGDAVLAGSGTRINAVGTNMTQGALTATNYPYDFALGGDGFFAVEDADQNIYYTRAGSFHLSERDESFYLVNADNMLVLDMNYSPIVVDGDALQDPSVENLNLGVFDFPNRNGLQKAANNCFVATGESQDSYAIGAEIVKQGYLENSNVDLPTEFSSVIKYQRAFQANTRIIQMADEMEQTLNNLR